jgi:uncharacterized protein
MDLAVEEYSDRYRCAGGIVIDVMIAGASIGLASWLHCVGMCGPLMSIFADTNSRSKSLNTALLLHHTGRITTYMMLGLLVGAASDALRIIVVGSAVSMASGALLILFALVHIAGGHLHVPDPLARLMRRLGGTFADATATIPAARPLVLGILNGLLPCGVSLSAVIASATIPDPLLRLVFVASFGIATVPALFGIGKLVLRLAAVWQTRLRSAMTYVMLVVGVVVLLRGLSLDVPYVSPKLIASDGEHAHNGCCGK